MNKFLSFLILGFLVVATMTSFNKHNFNTFKKQDPFVIPEHISAIFDKSCYGCHNSESSNEKAKATLMIDKLGDLKKSKLSSKLSKIVWELENRKMPPKKFAANYPDKIPSVEETTTLIDWAEVAKESL